MGYLHIANFIGGTMNYLITVGVVLNFVIITPPLIKKTYDKIKRWLEKRDSRIRLECEKKYLITGSEKDLFDHPFDKVQVQLNNYFKGNRKIYLDEGEKEETVKRLLKTKPADLKQQNMQNLTIRDAMDYEETMMTDNNENLSDF